MKVLVIGTGYVGLVTGACLAHHGNHVLCVDYDADKISMLQNGVSPIYEEGLKELIQAELRRGNIEFTTRVPSDNHDVKVALIAVGTPPTEDGAADLQYVFQAAEELAQKLPSGAIVATKSTVPVGTAGRLETLFNDLGRPDIKVASIPEFLREGTAVADTLQPHRLVFGVSDDETLEALRQLHAGIDAPVVPCDRSTAEMIKYASNAFLATKISFINEIANICERVQADVTKVSTGMGLDPRIGPSFLRAGLGYGGSCFPKDTRALVNIAGSVEYDFELLKAVVTVNQRQRLEPVRRLREWLGDFRGKRIALLGIAFKPGTDDVRESPALDLAEIFRREGADIRFTDPVVSHVLTDDGMCVVSRDIYETLTGSDAAVLVTEWPEFLSLNWSKAYQLMSRPYVFDGRNVLDPAMLTNLGFVHANIGSKTQVQSIEV